VTSIPPPAPAVFTADLHPFAPLAGNRVTPVSSLQVTCSALPEGGIRLAFALQGHITALRVPAKDAPGAGPLWQHTCFEAFLSAPGQERYREVNFSPAGSWAVSAFCRYREIECELTNQLAASAPPGIETEQRSDALLLAARLPPALLPSEPVLRIGLAAVIEHLNGQLEYWALHHPVAERADFHHSDGWTLRLDNRRAPP
jgi:hypothetical protein